MKKFRYTVRATSAWSTVIKAESHEEARAKANKLSLDSMNQDYVEEVDDEELEEITDGRKEV